MSAPDQASAKALHAPDASQTEVTGATDRAQLRTDYEGLGKRMRHWLLLGAALLALPLLWWLLPTERRLVPAATRGYRWRQAGTVQDSGTTWVWALADSAGQARLLLSRTRGRTWVARKLGVPAAQARALALGWGSPWRGVLLGQRGEVRVLPNVLREPQRGEALPSLPSPTSTVEALAVDTQGQRIVLKGNAIWQSSDGGKSWVTWQPDSPGMIDLGNRQVLDAAVQLFFEPTRQQFFAVSRVGILQQVAANGSAWKLLPNVPLAADSVLYAGATGTSGLLVVYHNGSAIQLSNAGNATSQLPAKFLAFTGLLQSPVALAGWHRAQPDSGAATRYNLLLGDSALLFEAAAEGGRVRRFRLSTQRVATSQSPAQQTLPDDSPTQAAPVTRAEAAGKDLSSRTRKPVQPAVGARRATPIPRQPQAKPTPTNAPARNKTATKSKPSTTLKSPASKSSSSDTMAPTPRQSPMQQMPIVPRATDTRKN